VARETRKLKRTQERKDQPSGKEKRAQLTRPLVQSQRPAAVDPFSPDAWRATLIRVGLILGGLWIVIGLIALMAQSSTIRWSAIGVGGALTVTVAGVLFWTLSRARKMKEVASIMASATSSEERKAALEKLSEGAARDPAKLFAKAQLEMQEDPKKALETLEQLDLTKHSGQVADEARGQRAMIHLMLGQVSLARQLVDNIDLKRSQDPRSRTMLSAVAAEAWARTGDVERATTALSAVEALEAAQGELKPQVLRAQAFVEAHAGKLKELKRTLKSMSQIDIRLLGAFLQGKTHPLLQKEAKRMVEQSGVIPRRMQVQRMR
jgi:hypothetical protein